MMNKQQTEETISNIMDVNLTKTLRQFLWRRQNSSSPSAWPIPHEELDCRNHNHSTS